MEIAPGYKQSDVGVIPVDWEVKSVGAMGEAHAGKALASKGVGQQRPYLRTKNVFDGRIDLDDVLHMPMTDADFSRYRLRDGDILLNEGQSVELVGRCAMYRGEYPAPCAIQNQLVRFRARDGVSAEFAAHLFRHCQKTGVFAKIALQTTSVAHLGVSRFQNLRLAWPSNCAEQAAIGEALNDADALIEGMEQLIAKKRHVKQGAMQELLTGRRRLSGFSGKWTQKSLGDLGRWTGGMTPSMRNPNYWAFGKIPWISSGDVKSVRLTSTAFPITQAAINDHATTLLPAASIVVVTRSGILRRYLPVAMNMIPMAINQDVKALITNGSVSTEFALHSLIANGPAILARCLKSGTTVESIELGWLKAFTIPLPPTADEQNAIAAIISTMDAEIAALEAKLAKARQLKQGMMQNLLTGRIRLIQPEKATESPAGHNWAFNEAVVIAVLAKSFGSEQYPLGRKRYTKLAYLMHRHHEHRAEGYLKKAAGPYNPATRYKGPEGIAVKNGYIRPHKRDQYSGFVAGDKIADAEGYFGKWYGADVLIWLEQFRRSKNDELELLATVDMAMEDLRRAGKPADLAGVKGIIREHPEWEAKLDRDIFSDPNIVRAVKKCRDLFQASE